ncbi:MAG: hypothetical protein JAZ05_11305, partial [Candidatus Thiodiazotropha taylori]|nr:hypothetical protein [Candidatus Thiodiazotropha taylori]MCW4292603.1 hypothetical protein [Candidatus Thiodiazotropha taylori]
QSAGLNSRLISIPAARNTNCQNQHKMAQVRQTANNLVTLQRGYLAEELRLINQTPRFKNAIRILDL